MRTDEHAIEPADGISLRELLQDPSLNLTLPVGDDDRLDQQLVGAHNTATEHPAAWLGRDWLMLTCADSMSADPQVQRELVRELDEAGVAGLGYGYDPDAGPRPLPRALYDEAARRGFPVFLIPPIVAFKDIVSTVYQSAISSTVREFNRAAAVQRYLMDALGEPDPAATVVRRLSRLLDCAVAITDEAGRVVDGAGAVETEEIVRQLPARVVGGVQFDVAEQHGFAFALSSAATPWLITAFPRRRAIKPMTKPAAQTAVSVITALERLERRVREQQTLERRATLEVLVRSASDAEIGIAAAAATRWGVDIAAGVVGLVVEPPSIGTVTDVDALLDGIERLPMRHSALPTALATGDGERVRVLVRGAQADAYAEHLVDALGSGFRIGVGRVVRDAADVADSIEDAELAIAGRVSGRGHGQISRYDDLDLASILMNELPIRRLRGRVEQWIQPLLDNDMVMSTVAVFLASDLDVGRTARVLGLHPNSIRYRLSRAEELLDAPLRSPSTIVALQVALAADDETATSGRPTGKRGAAAS